MSSAVLEAAKTCDKSMPGDSTLDAMCNAFLTSNIENILNVNYINLTVGPMWCLSLYTCSHIQTQANNLYYKGWFTVTSIYFFIDSVPSYEYSFEFNCK